MSKFRYMTENEIELYLAQIHHELTTCTRERMQQIDEEIRAANHALATGEFRRDATQNAGNAQRFAGPVGPLNLLATYGMATAQMNQQPTDNRANVVTGPTPELKAKWEQRGQALKDRRVVTFEPSDIAELRAITVASSNLLVPTHTSPTLAPAFNQVSSLVDVVNAPNLMGGNSYEKGFVVGYGEGNYTTETADYNEADPTFDYVVTGKAKITAYCEMSDEARRLPGPDYAAQAFMAVRTAIRKKIARQIVIGAGGANAITGIFNAPVNVLPTSGDLEISQIDEDTLDSIVFGHGGDEDVEADAYLILNKADLAAFSALKDYNGKHIYGIEKNGNTGTISSEGAFKVKYIINSACPALSAAATGSGTYCMAYGVPGVAYELPTFSPLEVAESTDFKFRSGHVCFRGVVWVGGNVSQYKGWTRIKKA